MNVIVFFVFFVIIGCKEILNFEPAHAPIFFWGGGGSEVKV